MFELLFIVLIILMALFPPAYAYLLFEDEILEFIKKIRDKQMEKQRKKALLKLADDMESMPDHEARKAYLAIKKEQGMW